MTSTRQLTLSGVNGDVIDLMNNSDYELGVSSTVHSGQSYDFQSKPLVGFDGDFVSGSTVEPKDLFLPVRILADSELDQDQLIARLAAAVGAQGQCQLTHTRDDGTKRSIYVQYRGGLDSLVVKHHLHHGPLVNLTFRAAEPFWFSHEEQPIEEFSLNGVDGTTGAVWTFDVDGDVPGVWPRWELEGHADNVHIIDLWSGDFLRVQEVIDPSQVIEIDTRPRYSGVWLDRAYLNSVVLDDASTFFPLRSGHNRILVKSSGLTPRGTLKVRWENRYFTP